MLSRAAAEPRTFVLGLDASREGMIEAAVKVARRGPPNACFVVAAAEALPCELDGLVDELRVHFPWGSLLRGLLALEDGRVLAGLARLLRPGASVVALVSVTERDRAGVQALPVLEACLAERLAAAYREHGLGLIEWRPATPAEIDEARSTWAKRLGARPVWLLRAERT